MANLGRNANCSGPTTAADDSYTTNEGQPLNEAAPGVLANDTDPENGLLTAELVSGPANGTLTLTPTAPSTTRPTPTSAAATRSPTRLTTARPAATRPR